MTRVRSILFISLAIAFPVGADSAESESPSGQRLALLIGNSNYEGFTLPGVTKSLDEVEKGLSAHGFKIVRRENVAKMDDQKAIVEEFARSVPTNGVALVYYIGLGSHVERFGKYDNLLRPTGEKVDNDSDYRSVGLNVDELLIKSLREKSGARSILIFLDACWESPIRPESDKVIGGMREFELGEDVTVMFAAGSGGTLATPASDEASALAKALAQHVGMFEESVGRGCEAIAGAAGTKPWIGGADPVGIGSRGAFAVAESPAGRKGAGDAFVNSVGMVFHWCPAGKFTMGSEIVDGAATRDRKAVEVTLSNGFWMGECEVTQREYNVVMGKNPPVGFTLHRNAPYWGVSESKSVTEFCKKLNELEKKSGRFPDGWEYLCPTEAEWEYACRAGTSSAYSFGESVSELGRYGNFADKALFDENPDFYWADVGADDGVGEALALVGSYLPNAWGLRDMHGNVSEMVADHHREELPGGQDPLVQMEKDGRPVIRGGAWCSLPVYCESSFRNTPPSRNKANFVGFRIALKKVK